MCQKKKSKIVVDFPLLLQHWHSTKNGDLRQEEISPGSRKRVWWKCERGLDHEWEARVRNRTHINMVAHSVQDENC